MKTLPPGQARILNYFADAEEKGHLASRAEAAKDLGYAFPSAVTKHIEALTRKGYVTSDRIKKRNVKLTEIGWQVLGRSPAERGIPVIGAIAAGVPILATENHSHYIEDLSPCAGRFALQVRGDSMIEAGINDGDYAIIDDTGRVDDGKIGAVIVDEEATLKRVRYESQGITLIPENINYQPTHFNADEAGRIQIVGSLCFVYRDFR